MGTWATHQYAQFCRKAILDGESWHFRYQKKAGKVEPVHDKCEPEYRTQNVVACQRSGAECDAGANDPQANRGKAIYSDLQL